jgi:hypothetical protein
MTAPDRKPSRAWLPLLIVAAGYTLALAIAVAWRLWPALGLDDYAAARELTTSDFRDFWWTARHFRVTGEITTDFGVHNYLPFFPIFMLPWSLLPLPVAGVLFTLLSVGLFAVAVVLAENLLADGLPARPRGPLLAALLLALPYVHACAVVGNVGLLLAFLIVAAWFLVERQQEWAAGAALGLATLIKLLPGVLIIFFLLKRRWRVAGGAAIVTVVLGVGMPLASLGPERTWQQHAAFFQRAAQGNSAIAAITSEPPFKRTYSNNALPIVLRRLLSPVDAAKETTTQPLRVNVADAPAGVILGVYIALVALLLAATVVPTLLKSPAWPPPDVLAGRSLRAQYGMWCALMLLAAPLVWTHYLPLLYWPLAILIDRVARWRKVANKWDLASATALTVWFAAIILLAWPAARAGGVQLLAIIALWLATVRATLRPR